MIFITVLTLPFMLRSPVDLPPILSVDLIQITDETSIPFAAKAAKTLEKIKKEEEKRVVSQQAPPTEKKKEKRVPLRAGGARKSFFFEKAPVRPALSLSPHDKSNYEWSLLIQVANDCCTGESTGGK